MGIVTRAAGVLVGATLALALGATAPRVAAQNAGRVRDDDRDRAFVEALRREDPAVAERYVALRDARARAAEDLERAETQYRAAGSALRSLVLPQLRQARRKYAESSLALVEFLDARDRQALARYQGEIERLNGILGERARARADFEKLLKD